MKKSLIVPRKQMLVYSVLLKFQNGKKRVLEKKLYIKIVKNKKFYQAMTLVGDPRNLFGPCMKEVSFLK